MLEDLGVARNVILKGILNKAKFLKYIYLASRKISF